MPKKSLEAIADHYSIEQYHRKIYSGSFKDFVLWVFEEIYKRDFVFNWHHQVIFEALEAVQKQQITNLLINIPPRHAKTELVVKQFVPWCLASNPLCNFLHLSYSESLASKNSNTAKQIIEHPKYQHLFPYPINKSEHGKKRWTLEAGGGLYATSSGGQVTGEGAGVKGSLGFSGAILIDDPMKADTERYETQLENTWLNFENVVSTRRNTPNTPVVLIMQRLHEADPSGRILAGESVLGKFEHIRLEGLREDSALFPNKHWLVEKHDQRKVGEALWESTLGQSDLKRIQTVNPTLFAGQYQQTPAPEEGEMVKKEWIRYYDAAPTEGRIVISCDLTFKDQGTSFVALNVYIVDKKNKIYLVDQVHGKMDFVTSEIKLKQLAKKWKYNAILVEDKANGPAMMSTLKNSGFHSVIPIQPKDSKVQRFARVTPYYYAGDIFYPRPESCPWIVGHIHEIVTFPKSAHDDRVDAESQFLDYYGKYMIVQEYYDIG